MKQRVYIFLLLLVVTGISASAQKPFAEGTIVYKVRLHAPDQKEYTGAYMFSIKGNDMRKELKLTNGYQDVVLINCMTKKVYSLQNRNGKKFAIQLNMDDMVKRQGRYNGFAMNNEAPGNNIAGYASYKGNISYSDGRNSDIVYTKEWYPPHSIMFEHFPDARFLPMLFTYSEENGMRMDFEIEKIEPGPVESGLFRIPADHKMISNEEYKQLSN